MFSASTKKPIEASIEVNADVDTSEAYKAGRKVRDFVLHANQEVHDRADHVTRQIKDKPVESSIIALAVGFLLGSILRRR